MNRQCEQISMPHRSGETGFKSLIFTCRKAHVVVTERFLEGTTGPLKVGRQVIQQLPKTLAFPDCISVCVAARDKLLVDSDAEHYSIEISMRTKEGRACEHDGGDYVCGGGFATNYTAELLPREKNMSRWLVDFFEKSDKELEIRRRAAPEAEQDDWRVQAVTFQEFHDILDIMRRALSAWFAVKRAKLFSVPPKTAALSLRFNDVLIKVLALSQYEQIERYREFCVTTTKLDDNITFELQWAVICEIAQIPLKTMAFVCKNKLAKQRKEQKIIFAQIKQDQTKRQSRAQERRQRLLDARNQLGQEPKRLNKLARVSRVLVEHGVAQFRNNRMRGTEKEPGPGTGAETCVPLFGTGKAENGSGLPPWLQKK